jgi:hypothetical protein
LEEICGAKENSALLALDKYSATKKKLEAEISLAKAEIEYMVGMIAADCEKRKLEKQNAN